MFFQMFCYPAWRLFQLCVQVLPHGPPPPSPQVAPMHCPPTLQGLGQQEQGEQEQEEGDGLQAMRWVREEQGDVTHGGWGEGADWGASIVWQQYGT